MVNNGILFGVKAIAEEIGMPCPKARRWAEDGKIPTYKIGNIICSTKVLLAEWLTENEETARMNRAKSWGHRLAA